jgi:hypothetical protein
MAAYKDVLAVIGQLYGADESTLAGKIRGRLQNLAKLGVPIGAQLGKGKSFDYGRAEIYQIILCMELAELGLTPFHASAIVKRWWKTDFAPDFEREWRSPSDDARIVIFEFSLMSKEWRESEEPRNYSITHCHASALGSVFKEMAKRGLSHFSVLDLTGLVRKVERAIESLPGAVDTAA